MDMFGISNEIENRPNSQQAFQFHIFFKIKYRSEFEFKFIIAKCTNCV